MWFHVSNKGEQMVCYYGCYSNVARGKRENVEEDAGLHFFAFPTTMFEVYRKGQRS